MQGYKPFENPLDDLRRKLTNEQYDEIRELYNEGIGISQRQLAKQYKVSRSLIGIIVNPARAKAVQDRIKSNWRDYADREAHTTAVKKLRKRKRELGLVYTIHSK